MNKRYSIGNLLLAVSLLLPLSLFAQVHDVCETNLPSQWKVLNGTLSLSTVHYKSGKESIKWNWKTGSILEINDSSFAGAIKDERSCFVIWIYNERPIKDQLIFNFGKQNRVSCSFTFNLDFTGWRTAWVMYNRDMKGKPVTGMQWLRVKAPATVKAGNLFFDQVMYCTTVDPRAPMRDLQVPFVNEKGGDKAANAHWTSLLHFSQIPHHIALPKQVSGKDISDAETILKRYEKIILTSNEFKKNQLVTIDSAFENYNIKRNGQFISGRPVNSINAYEILQDLPLAEAKALARDYGVENAADLLLKIASAYRSDKTLPFQKEKLAQQFVDLLLHLHDQGWAYGSGMGSLHHLGYYFRNYFSACLLMKPVLKQQELDEMIWKDMYWFSGLGRTKELPEKMPSSNIDVFNTLLGGMLSTILFMDDTPKKFLQLNEFSQWLSHNIGPEYAIEGTFKPDGSIMHHGTLYPAYAIDGLKGLAPVVYCISNTGFSISPTAYNVVKNALLKMHYYTNPLYWPISVAGRHPTGNWKLAAEPFAYMAASKSGSVDTLLASAYLHILNGNLKTDWAKQFLKSGIKSATYPTGHWDINYGLFSIHRRNNWLLTVRGHNRYFVSHESYPGANMYGRYCSYGNTELLYPSNTDNNGSYFKDEGWDWNHVPGSTTLYLPLEKLRSNVVNPDDFSGVEEMLLTDEIFCGGSSFGKQGMFAMKLHGHDKYDMGGFKAIKSWFMFDSIIVCLGSNISDAGSIYPVHTTLFQNYLADTSALLNLNGQSISVFPFHQQVKDHQQLTVIDNRNTGYYLPDVNRVNIFKQKQFSRNQQDTKNTEGLFAGLIIDHGIAAQNARYEYAMVINTNKKALNDFAASMKSAQPVYKVLQQDSSAHIVYYSPANITAYALFKAGTVLNDAVVQSVSRPCLLMRSEKEGSLTVTITDPDLAFYEGHDDTPLLPNGKRKEVSIYSKQWYKSPAKNSVITLVIKGKWKLFSQNKDCKIRIEKNGNTTLEVKCSNGQPSLFSLVRAE